MGPGVLPSADTMQKSLASYARRCAKEWAHVLCKGMPCLKARLSMCMWRVPLATIKIVSGFGCQQLINKQKYAKNHAAPPGPCQSSLPATRHKNPGSGSDARCPPARQMHGAGIKSTGYTLSSSQFCNLRRKILSSKLQLQYHFLLQDSRNKAREVPGVLPANHQRLCRFGSNLAGQSTIIFPSVKPMGVNRTPRNESYPC